MPREIRDLESLLRINFGNELTLVNYSIDNLVPAGENFRSCVLKLSAQVQRTKDSPDGNEVLEFVVKTAPTDVVLEITKNVDWIRLFRREIFMYTSVLPLYNRIELDSGFGEDDSIVEYFPKFYGCRVSASGEDAVILLENLKLRNYYVVDKRIGE